MKLIFITDPAYFIASWSYSASLFVFNVHVIILFHLPKFVLLMLNTAQPAALTINFRFFNSCEYVESRSLRTRTLLLLKENSYLPCCKKSVLMPFVPMQPSKYFLFSLCRISQDSNTEFDLIFFNYFPFLILKKKIELVDAFCVVLSMIRM